MWKEAIGKPKKAGRRSRNGFWPPVPAILYPVLSDICAGWPLRLVSDQGGEFCNQLAEELRSDVYGYTHLKTCSFSPKGNSAVEGRHKHMNVMFKICCRKYRKNWVQGLPLINWCVNTRPYRETEVTPFQMFFGAVPPSLADAVLDEAWSTKLGLNYKKFMSQEEWLRNKYEHCNERCFGNCE